VAADSQLAGAFVVDPPGTRQPDRFFVFGHWDEPQTLSSASQSGTGDGR
jgi:hypothetical protein